MKSSSESTGTKKNIPIRISKETLTRLFQISIEQDLVVLTNQENLTGEALPLAELRDKEREKKLNELLAKAIAACMARRMKLNRRNIPLYCGRTISRIAFEEMVSWLKQDEGEAFMGDKQEMAILRNMVRSMIGDQLTRFLQAETLGGERDIYDESWKWVGIALKLAEEQGLAPEEALRREGTGDEITRRMYTRGEYMELRKRVIESSLPDEKTVLDAILRPILKMAVRSGLPEEDLTEMRQGAEITIMPVMKQKIAGMRKELQEELYRKVARVWG